MALRGVGWDKVARGRVGWQGKGRDWIVLRLDRLVVGSDCGWIRLWLGWISIGLVWGWIVCFKKVVGC